jgi:hypothetical protein
MAKHRPEFGRRPGYAVPQGGLQVQAPARFHKILIFLAMPVVGFLIVTLIR